MFIRLAAFLGTVTAMPILAQVNPSTVAGKLSVASGQTVLSIVLVAETVAFYKFFKLWRADVEAERQSARDDRIHTDSIIADNAASQAQVATAIQNMTASINNCEKR